MRVFNNFYVFLESVVSPTAVGEEKGSRDPEVRRGRLWGTEARRRQDLGCIEGGSGELGEMAVDDAGEKHN
jgi:hypothetical protein